MDNVWDDVPDWGGVGARRLARPDDCSLGASVWDLQPGGENWYHLHHGSEELVVVLRGTPTLRTPDSERVLAESDVIVFSRGPAGAKGIRNDSPEPVRVLIASTNADPDVTEYPDTRKVGFVVGGELHVHRSGDEIAHAGPE
ncbi:MAG: cupin domain-containing protein [Gaiellaceae bacterium]